MSNASVQRFFFSNTVAPGATASGTISLCNDDSDTWAPGQFNLGLTQPQDNGTWGTSRVALPAPCAPGQVLCVPFSLKAPATPGQYVLAFQMVHEGVAWFGEQAYGLVNVGVPGCVLPPPRADANDLVTAQVLSAGGYPSQGAGALRWDCWTNTTGRTLHIRRADLWVGIGIHGIADVDLSVWRSDGSYLGRIGWDHYAEPVAPSVVSIPHDPYFALLPGEQLCMRCFVGTVGLLGQFMVGIAAQYA